MAATVRWMCTARATPATRATPPKGATPTRTPTPPATGTGTGTGTGGTSAASLVVGTYTGPITGPLIDPNYTIDVTEVDADTINVSGSGITAFDAPIVASGGDVDQQGTWTDGTFAYGGDGLSITHTPQSLSFTGTRDQTENKPLAIGQLQISLWVAAIAGTRTSVACSPSSTEASRRMTSGG